MTAMDKALDWAYGKAFDQVTGMLVSSKDQASMVRWECAKAGTVGFASGVGGLTTLPLTLPAELASLLALQLRLVAAIAVSHGHDLRSEKVRTAAYICLLGNSAREVAHEAGVQLGKAMTLKAIGAISAETIKAINKAVGFRLLTKFGQTGTLRLGRLVPVVGGVLGGTVDYVSTRTVARVANKMFGS